MPIQKLIKIYENGEIKEDIYFERKDKTFIQELREGLTPEIRKRVSKRIEEILSRENKLKEVSNSKA